MKNYKHLLGSLCVCASGAFLCSMLLTGCDTDAKKLSVGEWTLSYDKQANGIDIEKGTKLLYDNLHATYRLDGTDKTISSRDYAKRKITTKAINDQFGEGFCYQVTYSGEELPTLVQSFYLYSGHDYVLTDFTLADEAGLASNYMAPINVDRMPPVLAENGSSRALFMPFDNDKWVRYQSHPLDFTTLTSYEATAILNNDNRNALVVGSVEHDNWKSAITLGKGTIHNVGSLVAYGGVADELTRDVKSHGALKGTELKSPKLFMGYFNDWRQGLETYGQANAIVSPPKAWDKAVPFGWNSWGALQFNLNFQNATEVSDYYKNHLQNNHFVNSDNAVYVGLDSGWNSFTEEQLKAFADRCKQNGQVPGIYWTPFTDWGRDPEREIKEVPGTKFKDVYLYANGKPQELDGAYAVDPTHPAIEAMMKHFSELFRRTGYEYVKMDFMTHGAMEADKWHKAEISTGIQGYNYGMQLLDRYFGDMYINLSISPVFPAQYAQSRRIACDAWNKMKDTEYTLNALSYGWWQDRVYQFNDADHIVLRDATEGENRARVTSGVITGIFLAGDDYSQGGPKAVKEKAQAFLTNAAVNAVATGEAFRPVDGNGERSENQFVRINEDGSGYYAVFNYSKEPLQLTVSMERLGLDKERKYKVNELWSRAKSVAKETLEVTIPAEDVVLYKLD